MRAGDGGAGTASFRREAHVPRGGPDGGDGGRGGAVVLICDDSLRDLQSLRRRTHYRAQAGAGGEGALRHGARGEDLLLRVPPGTVVEAAAGEQGEALAHRSWELLAPGQRATVARGGAGGRGNKHFATATRQAPRFAEWGLPGEQAWLELRLKLLADVGLVGMPNAGKSSLLSRLTRAAPKVAEYPFTTLSPNLGTVEAPDGRQLVVADVPGLIEGASEGVGLGHEFLAHLERARLLLHVIDSSEGDAAERWHTIDAELAAYGAGLDERPQVVVLNKTDLSPEPPAFEIEDERIVRVFRVSAATGAGIDALKLALFELVPPDEIVPAAPGDEEELVDFLVYRPQPARRAYRVFRTERGFRITGRAPAPQELEAILKAAGAREGDEIEVGEEVLEWK